MELHEALDVQSTKFVTDARVQLASAKEALQVLEGRASADRLAVPSAVEYRDCMQGELATTSALLRITKRGLTATFDPFKRHSSNVQAAEATVQERIKSNLGNNIQTIFNGVKQIIKAYQLNVDGHISSLGTALPEDMGSMCAQITEHIDTVRRDVSNSGEVLSWQCVRIRD